MSHCMSYCMSYSMSHQILMEYDVVHGVESSLCDYGVRLDHNLLDMSLTLRRIHLELEFSGLHFTSKLALSKKVSTHACAGAELNSTSQSEQLVCVVVAVQNIVHSHGNCAWSFNKGPQETSRQQHNTNMKLPLQSVRLSHA